MKFEKIVKFLFNPKLSIFIFVIFIITYLFILGEEGAFTKKFLNFGPSEDAKFINIKLNSWRIIIVIVIFIFISTLIQRYYDSVIATLLGNTVFNPAYNKKIQVSKLLSILIIIIEPTLVFLLQTFDFFIYNTLQLQIILPKILADILVEVPFVLYTMNKKKFIS